VTNRDILVAGGIAAGIAGMFVLHWARMQRDPKQITGFVRTSSSSSARDELYDGGWTLYDVSETQSPEMSEAAKSIRTGQMVALLLGHPAPPLAFLVRVIPGGPPGRYTGQWVTKKPVGGPDFAEFAPYHVFDIVG
jgi:hypothetical protein